MHPPVEMALLIFLTLERVIIRALPNNHVCAMLRKRLECHKNQFLHRMMPQRHVKASRCPG